MINHGKVQSTVRPEDILVDENSAWIAEDITEVSENLGEENEFIGYEYTLKQYSKDDYIVHMSDQRKLDKFENDLAMAELAEALMEVFV